MTPATFPEANTHFGPPADMTEAQCGTIPAHIHTVIGGNLDGALEIVLAWLPSENDIDRMIKGHPVYVTMLGGVVPHRLTTSFQEAVS